MMSIQVEETFFYIHGKNTSIIIENVNGYLLLRHVGRRVNQYHQSNAVFEKDHAFSGNPEPHNRTFSFDTQRQVIGQHGLGDFRQPSLKVQHHQNEVTDFKLADYEIVKGNVVLTALPTVHSFNDAESIIFNLVDEVAQVSLKLIYTASATEDTILVHQVFENKGEEPLVLHRALSAMFDVPAKAYDVITLQGAYAREKTVRRQPVTQGFYKVGSNRGASGHGQTPALILVDSQTTEQAGEAFALQLIYSGNFQTFVEQNQLNEVRVAIGLNDDNFSWQLNPGEQFETPVALFSYSANGLNALSDESRRFVQNHIIPATFAHELRPILINNWEATYFDFNGEKLLALADEAASLGIELFVLDDGWFGNRFDDNRALGDWWVNEEKLGGTLKELIDEVHQRGLQFGIWVEPEMISEDSDLYRNHPDWAIQVPNRSHTYSRNQLVLDLSNPEVVAYLKTTIDQLLENHEIDYVKWDMNRNITKIGNGTTYLETKAQSHAYMLGLYDLVSYLTEKHDNILFESCSGGGGRNDLGMLRYFPQVWASDDTDAMARLPIQYGSSYLYPTISMGAHVSVSPNHQLGRTTPIETRGHVAMMGNLGYELDLTSLSAANKAVIKEQVAAYKMIRPIIQLGKQYRLINPEADSNEAAVQFNYQDQVVVTYVRILSTIETIETTLKLVGLEEDSLYQLVDSDTVYSGAELMYAGLTMALPQGDFLTKQLHFIKK